MSLYYEDEYVQLHHGDCRAIRGWTSASVLVTDPPYGTQFSAVNPKGGYGRRGVGGLPPEGFTIANDDTTETRDKILELWGGDNPAPVFGSPRLPDPPGHWEDRIVWDKRRPGMNGGPWRYTHESIYSRGFVRNGNDNFSILTAFPVDQHMHIHAKPVALMESLLACAPSGVIADPFAGSGSTLIAARTAS
jgi:site-specific DNA-methyltransferase (adenine-specific)